MIKFTPWTRRLIIIGLIMLPMYSLYLDVNLGKDLAVLVLGGFLGVLTNDD